MGKLQDSRAIKSEFCLLDLKVKTTKCTCHTNHEAQNKHNDGCLGDQTRQNSSATVTPPHTTCSSACLAATWIFLFDSNNLEISPTILSIVISEAVNNSAR